MIMLLFSGERREGDLAHWLYALAWEAGFQILVLTADLREDEGWDLACPKTFARLYQLCAEGLVDIIFGGPPCSTVSRARHNFIQGGPRPLRFRDCPWGRPDLTAAESALVATANTLWINFLALSEAVVKAGGAYGLEHPADPGVPPFASIFILPELLNLETLAGAVRPSFDQCALGGLSKKPTEISGNIHGLTRLSASKCPGLSGQHVHHKSYGRNGCGGFHSKKLERYPAGLCKELASCVVETLAHYRNSFLGPTGALADHQRRLKNRGSWSVPASESGPGIMLLNEASAYGRRCLINENMLAIYVHVDDHVILGHSPKAADELLKLHNRPQGLRNRKGSWLLA